MSEPVRLPSSTLAIPTQEAGRSELPSLPAPDLQLKVELDDRCFLFPAAKNLTHVHFLAYEAEKLRIDMVFPYNTNQTATEFLELDAKSVPELTRKLVEAVYRAGSFLLINDGVTITFTTFPNGYALQVGDFESKRELFISTNCIWRFCGAFCRAVDGMTVRQSH